MLKFLFGGLTAQPARGAPLFEAVTRLARGRAWYVEGQIPDTLEGRFAMLATTTALVMIRLEALGERGDALSVALTEQFVEVMESEHRELGIGDPKLGRTVRKLVGALARRVDIWRPVLGGGAGWEAAVKDSLPAPPAAHRWLAESLRELWDRLADCGFEYLQEGRIE